MPTLACIQEALKLQPSRRIILIELVIAGTTYRYANTEDADIVWNGQTWARNQIAIETIASQNIEGDFGSQTLSMQNVDQALGEIIRLNDVRGESAVVVEVFEALLANPSDAIGTWKNIIAEADYDDGAAKFTIETLFSENRNDFPQQVRDLNVCGFDYDTDGSDEIALQTCGFFTLYKNLGGTLDTANYPAADASLCDKGLRTPNGCYAHFNQQDSLKPAIRARMYPGIPLVPIQNIQ